MKNMLPIRVGCWESHIILAFNPQDEPLLKMAGLTSGAEILHDDGTLLVAPDPKGIWPTNVRGCGSKNSTPYSRELDFDSRRLRHTKFGLSRFGMFEVESVLEPESMMIQLPEIHELPWFRIAKDDPALGWPDICARELEIRMTSAVQAGLKNLDVPDMIKRYIDASTWSGIMKRAKEARPNRE